MKFHEFCNWILGKNFHSEESLRGWSKTWLLTKSSLYVFVTRNGYNIVTKISVANASSVIIVACHNIDTNVPDVAKTLALANQLKGESEKINELLCDAIRIYVDRRGSGNSEDGFKVLKEKIYDTINKSFD